MLQNLIQFVMWVGICFKTYNYRCPHTGVYNCTCILMYNCQYRQQRCGQYRQSRLDSNFTRKTGSVYIREHPLSL